MTLKTDAKFEEILICCFKSDKNLVNFDISTQNSQNFYFDWFPCAKYITFDLKSTEELHFITLKSDAKFEEKLTCGLENFTRALESLKIGTSMGSFYPK